MALSKQLSGLWFKISFIFQTEELLKSGGATSKTYMSVDVTHVLAGSDAETDQLQEISEIYEDIPLIKGELWVQLSVRCGQILPTSCFEAAPSATSSHVFKSLHFSLSGLLSLQDIHRLWALVIVHGGQFTREFNPSTTHLICSNKAGHKYNKAMSFEAENRVKIVTPDFITECVKAKNLLPVENFHPRLMVLPGENYETPSAKRVKKKRPPQVVEEQPPPAPAPEPMDQSEPPKAVVTPPKEPPVPVTSKEQSPMTSAPVTTTTPTTPTAIPQPPQQHQQPVVQQQQQPVRPHLMQQQARPQHPVQQHQQPMPQQGQANQRQPTPQGFQMQNPQQQPQQRMMMVSQQQQQQQQMQMRPVMSQAGQQMPPSSLPQQQHQVRTSKDL